MKHSHSQQAYESSPYQDRRQSLMQSIGPSGQLRFLKENHYSFEPDFEGVSRPHDSSLQECPICKVAFNLLMAKQQCLRCGDTVCKHCSQSKVNGRRVCDVCFYELANYEETQQREQKLEEVRQENKKVLDNIQVHKDMIRNLQTDIQRTNQETADFGTTQCEEQEKLNEILASLTQEHAEVKEKRDHMESQFTEQRKIFNGLRDEAQKLENKVIAKQKEHQQLTKEYEDKHQRFKQKEEELRQLNAQ